MEELSPAALWRGADGSLQLVSCAQGGVWLPARKVLDSFGALGWRWSQTVSAKVEAVGGEVPPSPEGSSTALPSSLQEAAGGRLGSHRALWGELHKGNGCQFLTKLLQHHHSLEEGHVLHPAGEPKQMLVSSLCWGLAPPPCLTQCSGPESSTQLAACVEHKHGAAYA